MKLFCYVLLFSRLRIIKDMKDTARVKGAHVGLQRIAARIWGGELIGLLLLFRFFMSHFFHLVFFVSPKLSIFLR